ncbi:MAG TPA: transglutaminase family protein, partial [Acidimicrobiales bacterium]
MSAAASSALLQIRHVTGFVYDGYAESSYNEARMTPLALPRQRVIDALLTVHPTALQSTYRDYFGTIVTTFDLHEAHNRLEVLAEATVETFAETLNQPAIDFSSLHAANMVDAFAEYLAPTTRTTMSSDVLAELRELVGVQNDVREAVQAVMTRVHDQVTYFRGSTLVSSTAQEVWEQRQGVCQDLSHVTIAMLRCLGIPARYVSGYLHADADAEVGEMVVG